MANGPPAQEIKPTSPLDSDKYFASPLATILESINDSQNEYITLHDLAEAYATLSYRIRLQAPALLANNRVFPALKSLQMNNTSFSLCLIRDIGRCLLNPYSIFSQPESVDDDSSVEEGTERAQAYATLSHHVLVFLSDVFSFMPVMNSFSANQLRDLLREVLLILCNRHLPTPNFKKTWELAVWILTSQRLPPDILLSHKQELETVLTRLVQGDFAGNSLRIEGLKLFSVLFRTQASAFIDSLLSLYPSILAFSTEDAFDTQMQTLKTLRCVVSIKLDSPDARWSRKIASLTRSFIKTQAAKRKASQGTSLQDILLSAMKGTDSYWNTKGPLWASLMVACLICLIDADLFTHPQSLKLFLSVLAQATNHKRTYVRTLHPHIWNCLVWCYSRLPFSTKDPHTGQDFVEIRKRAFLVLRQELKGGIATALVASFLSSPSSTSEGIAPALDIVKTLLSASKEKQVQEGIKILARLVSNVGSPTAGLQSDPRDLSDILVRDLFVGSFLDLPVEKMKALSDCLPGPDDRFIRPLEENQIRKNWRELLQLWAHGVNRIHGSGINPDQYEVSVAHALSELNPNLSNLSDHPTQDRLLAIWQTLLLAQSQLTPNSTSLSISPSTAEQITDIFTGFITRTESTVDQFRQLHLVQKLWSVVTQTYGAQYLAPLAESILSAVLRQKYALDEDENVKAKWGSLCADLISVGIPNLLHSVFVGSESQERLEVQRQLWVTMASNDKLKANESGLEELLSFLAVPLQSWNLDPSEIKTWTGLFNAVLEVATSLLVTPDMVVNSFLQKLGEAKVKSLVTCPGILPALVSRVRFNGDDALHLDLLLVVNELLIRLYPPAPEDHILAMSILDGVAHIISSLDEKNVARLLSSLKDGLCIWIRDDNKSLLEQEHSTLIRDIYCASLTILSNLPPSAEALQDLSPFLASSFERIGHPPIGPLAFEQFWRATYHDQPEDLKRLIPDDLRMCLKAWSDHCGDSLAEGVPSVSGSQSTSRSVIPDSQSPNKTTFGPGDEGLSRVMDSDDIYDLIALTPGPVPVGESQHTQAAETPRATTPKATRRQHLLQGAENASHSVIDSVSIALVVDESGQAGVTKRRNSHSTVPIPKRQRMEDDSNTSRDSTVIRPLHPHALPELDSGLVPSKADYSKAPLKTNTSRPVSNTRRSRTPERRPRRHNVPEPSATIFKTQKHQSDKGKARATYGEDEVVDDSTEMEKPPYLGHQDFDLHTPKSKSQKLSPTKRLQSEPAFESSYPSRPTTLRRNHSTSNGLGALERAYTLVAETQGVSQVPVEDLARAARLAHEIGAKIHEQLSKKLGNGP